jgi:cysteine-rich repeat protein
MRNLGQIIFLATLAIFGLISFWACENNLAPPKPVLNPEAGSSFIDPGPNPTPQVSPTPVLIWPPSSGAGSHRNLCGNRRIDTNEECDDGNRVNNDGCDLHCRHEPIFRLCHWICDDPLCPAACSPVCEPPRCQTQCEEVASPTNCLCNVSCGPPFCEIRCPDDGCESDSCPQCETICEPSNCTTQCTQINPQGPTCVPPAPECSPLCQETQCAWMCQKPECPEPQCELQCELPASVCEEKP